MATMPNIVGLDLQAAEGALAAAGVLNVNAIGYFGTWPISVAWNGAKSLNAPPGTVTAQSIAAGLLVVANAGMILSVVPYPIAVTYPAWGPGSVGGFVFGESGFGQQAF